MPRFQVNAQMTISVHTIVEAKDAKEAKRLAEERTVQGLCHQCAGSTRFKENEEEWRTSGELDGEPTELEVERL